jgi:citrate lyase subunit beta / citryl-CoA lyase
VRSKLFVPGSRPELFAKALAGQADAISIDLEDSVIASRKNEARTIVANFLQSVEVQSSNKLIMVRCNAPGTKYFEPDLLAISQPGLAMVNVPKVESAEEVNATVEVLKSTESANGVTQPIRILANIESPKGLRLVSQIAAAHSRVAGLQLGLNDLFESLAIDRRDTASVHTVMFAIRMAAAESGIFAYDGAFADIEDESGYCAEANMAHRLGYLGKSCIHPRQVALANNEFVTSDNDIEFARRIIKAVSQAKSHGAGAFTIDGKMIDAPSIKRAKRIIAASQQNLGDRQ